MASSSYAGEDGWLFQPGTLCGHVTWGTSCSITLPIGLEYIYTEIGLVLKCFRMKGNQHSVTAFRSEANWFRCSTHSPNHWISTEEWKLVKPKLKGPPLIHAWMSKLWGEITYPSPNFNGCTVEVWEWISNFIPQLLIDASTYPCWD